MTRSFDLLERPWVLVSDDSGSVHQLSSLDVFRRAPEMSLIAGEIPTQAAAVLRLHLAIAHRALAPQRPRPLESAMEEWATWWQAGTVPLERIEAYLRAHQDRFDLFDPVAPFMQVADLHTATGSTSGLVKLIAEVPDGEKFFTTRAGSSIERIDAAEAARWLVHAQAYDPSGIKTGAVGDPRVKGGRGYPIGQGWTGRIGLVIVEGATLAETLLLNLDLSTPSPTDDRPVWERAPVTAAPEGDDPDGGRPPRGVVDLLTWQVRRVRLLGEGEWVDDVVIANGDRVTPQNQQHREAATAYRYSDPQTKELGHDVYMPLEHPPEQALWRGLAPLLSESRASAGEKPARLRPPLLTWLAALRDSGDLPANHPVRLRAVGMQYGTHAASIVGVTDDALALRAGILTDPAARAEVVAAVDATHAAVGCLRTLAANLVLAAGGDADDGARSRAEELAYGALHLPFVRWLAHLDLEDLDAGGDRWHVAARAILRGLAAELIESAGPAALRGRVVTPGRGAARLLDAGRAEIYFLSGLAKALDRGLPEVASDDDDDPQESTA